jgi:hypothetical protein
LIGKEVKRGGGVSSEKVTVVLIGGEAKMQGWHA